MSSTKRIFVAFAMEDVELKRLFTGQAKNAKVPYEFVDMSVKEPWESEWKQKCRSRIKGCDGVIILVSKNTKNASGALWEITCTIEEKIPAIGIYIDGATASHIPNSMLSIPCYTWTWENVKNFIESL